MKKKAPPNQTLETKGSGREGELEDFKRRFREQEKKCRSLKKRAESKVCEWRWASDDMCSLIPAGLESGPLGKWLKGEPKNRLDKARCGLDAGGRVVVQQMEMDNDVREWLCFYEPERAWYVYFCLDHYQEAPELGVFCELTLSHGRPRLYESLHIWANEYQNTRYTLESGRVQAPRHAA